MALTGVLKADFSDFQTAVTQAETKLVSFQTSAGKVEGSLNRMASSLSGTRLIADATLMTEAVARAGGASTLTASQMASVNTKVGEAIEKFRALGQEAPAAMTALHIATLRVPPALDGVIASAGRTGGSIATLRDGVGQFDRTLAQVGLSLGPLPGALTEIASAAGKTATQIGLVGTAGLTTAAALGGWSLGRMIAEFTETDKIIGDATAKLLGWGDVAAEEAAAGADTLAIASQKAGREITSMDEAVKFLTASASANAAAIEAQTKAIKALADESERIGKTAGGQRAADLNGPGFRTSAAAENKEFAEQERLAQEYLQQQITSRIRLIELQGASTAAARDFNLEILKSIKIEEEIGAAIFKNAMILKEAKGGEAATLDRLLKASGANPTAPDPVGDILGRAQADVNRLTRDGEIGADAEAAIWARANVEIAATVQGLGHVVDRTRAAVTEAEKLAASFGASASTMGGVDPRAPVQGESIFQSGKFAASPFIGGFAQPTAPMINMTMNGVIATEREALRRMISDLIMEGTRQGRALPPAR